MNQTEAKPPNPNTEVLYIYVSPALKAAVERAAVAIERPVAWYVRDVLRRAVEPEK